MMNWKQCKRILFIGLTILLAIPVMGISVQAAESASLPDVKLPTGAEFMLESMEVSATVVWDQGAPAQLQDQPGVYRYSGVTTIALGKTKPQRFKARIHIDVDANSVNQNAAPGETSQAGFDLLAVSDLKLLGNSDIQADVFMDPGFPEIDREAGGYRITGALKLTVGVENPQSYQARLTIVTDVKLLVDVIGVVFFEDIRVPYGTPRSELKLPAEAEVLLNNKQRVTAAVTWEEGDPEYDANQPGMYYMFKGTLALPQGIENPGNYKASVYVFVEEKSDVTNIEKLSSLKVAYGTPRSELDLPAEVEATLSDDKTIKAAVTWNQGTPAYDANQPGTYTFEGSLTLPAGVDNPEDYKASLDVTVSEKPALNVIGVEKLSGKMVPYGTSSSKLDLPAEVEVSLSDNTKLTAAIVWDQGTPAYNGNQAGTYRFKGALTLLDGVMNSDDWKAELEIKVAPRVSIPSLPAPEQSESGNPNMNCGAQGCMLQTEYGLSINVPMDAANSDFALTVDKRELNQTQRERLPQHAQLLSVALELSKTFESQFTNTVTLIFAFDQEKLTDGQIPALYQYDTTRQSWTEVPSRVENGKLIADVNQFALFVLLAVQESENEEQPGVEQVVLGDIKGHWAQEAIERAVSLQIVQGYEDGSFRPGETITRQAFITMLARAFQWPAAMQRTDFKDAGQIAAWANDAIAAASERGLMQGYEDGSFRPNDAVTRAQLAVIAAGMLPNSAVPAESGLAHFADAQAIPRWARAAFQAAISEQILVGTEKSELQPLRNVTRVEAIVIILRLMDKLTEK